MVARLVSHYVISGAVLVGLLGAVSAAGESSGAGQAAMQRYEEARAKQKDAIAARDAETYNAQELAAANALAEARSAFKAQYEGSGNGADALGYIKTLRLEGEHDLAAEIARDALDSGLESAAIWREYGTCLLAMGPEHVPAGIDALYNALDSDSGGSPDSVMALNELGDYYLEQAMPLAAGDSFGRALAMDEGNVRARLGLSVVDVYNGNIAEASRRLRDIGAAAQPFDVPLRDHLRTALWDFEKNRRQFSDTAENHHAYARLMYAAARLPKAILAADRAAHLAGTDPEIWNFLAVMQVQLGDLAAAKRSYEGSLDADPNQPQVQETLKAIEEQLQGNAQSQQSPVGQGKGPLR